ncbi:efflux RND transporter periplasmic adaptor subunit [Candidatus Poribacteria bacterium]|nr:efflux RND transporter periplasmic adaptor subunit [Candidatus Poribacteria bacterium]MYA55281.1 efflux RND transporter periplasmic adaptor subunit [Candidatus Poribacteria bacterium]
MINRHLLRVCAIIFSFSVGSVIAQKAASPITVPVATARRGTIVSTKQYTGHLEPHAEVKVYANVPGKIVALTATVGQSVAKDDVLAETDSREATLAVIRAESAFSSVKSRLTSTEANAQADVESQLAIAQETLMTAQSNLVETQALAEMRVRNQLVQAEATSQAAVETIEKSKTNAEQSLERAKVEHDDAESDYNRNKSLHEKQLISDSNFESVEKRLRLAETRLEEAQVTASQFVDDSTHPSIEKAKAELAVAQKLVEIRSWEREIALAESKVTQAQADRNAAQKLVAAKSWEQEIEIAKAAVRQAEEQRKLAQEQARAATLKSPIDGVIAERHLNMGDYAGSATSPTGKPVFTVIGVDALKAIWKMPVTDARRIHSGELVLISTDAGIRNIVGTIDFISPTVNREDNTVLVHANVPNSVGTLSHTGGLRPGGTITVSVKMGERKNVQLLPLHAVLHIQNGSGTTFTVEGNTARREQVSVGAIYGGEIEITSKLAAGTLIIVDKQHQLQDGTPVSILRD